MLRRPRARVLLAALLSIVVTLSGQPAMSTPARPDRKASLTSPADLDPCNEFLAFQTTTNGLFNIGVNTQQDAACTPLPDRWDLTYRWPEPPGTSFTSVKTDSGVHRLGHDVPADSANQAEGATEHRYTLPNGLTVTQRLRFTEGFAPDRQDMLLIEYAVDNPTTAARPLGLRVMLDTELNYNDGAPFQVPGHGAIVRETEFNGSDVPQFYTAFQDFQDPEHISAGLLDGAGGIEPHRVVFAQWPGLQDNHFEYTIDPDRGITDDSAVGLYFDAPSGLIQPGQTVLFRTRYGRANVSADFRPPLSLVVLAPAAGAPSAPFEVQAFVSNVGGADAVAPTAELELPTGYRAEQPLRQSLGARLRPGESRSLRWTVTPPRTAGTAELAITVSADGIPSKTVTRQYTVNSPPQVVSPGQTLGQPGTGLHGENPTRAGGDPVNTATGAYFTSVLDAELANLGLPFRFERSYNSSDEHAGDLGPGWTHSYAPFLEVAEVGDVTLHGENGQQIRYTRQADGTFVGAPGARSRLQALADGYELTRHDQVRYRFDRAGRLLALRDRFDHGTALHYRGGQLRSISTAGGQIVRLRHRGDRLAALRLPDGRAVRYSYAGGRLAAVRDLRGGLTRYAYDAGGRLTRIVDAIGHDVVRNVYGADGRVVEQLDARGNRTTFAWDATTGVSTVTDARGNHWRHVYEGGVLRQEIDPLGGVTAYGYDDDLNVTSVTDPRGHTLRMRYDAAGNELERLAPAPLRYRQLHAWNERNDPVRVTDGRGGVTAFTYDASGQLIRRTDPVGAVTTFVPAPTAGLPGRITDPAGRTTRLSYNRLGRPTQVVSPGGAVTTLSYDRAGRLVAQIDPRGHANRAGGFRTRFRYTRTDQLTDVIDPLGHRTHYAYDLVGNLVRRTDPKGRVTRYHYDPANQLVAVTAPDGATTQFHYDEVGNLVRRTDPLGRVTRYEYDAANRRTATVSPTGQRWTIDHDAAGNATTMVNPAGNATPEAGDGAIRVGYDPLGRPTTVDYSDGTPDVGFEYDANSNRVRMTDGDGTETREYDARNQLVELARGRHRTRYQYNAAGELTRRTYPDGTRADLSYDRDGRLAAVTSNGATTSYAYDPAGNLVRTVLPPSTGYTERRVYDRAGRLIRVRSARGNHTLSDVRAWLDPAGNPVVERRPDGVVRYRYDKQDRLVGACYGAGCRAGSIRYGYDLAGNRTTEHRRNLPNAGTWRSTYDAADQLVQVDGPHGRVPYGSDPNGNMTAAGSHRFRYDLANRLTHAQVGDGATVDYTYDGEGRRLTADTGGADGRIRYTWDVNGVVPQLVAEHDGQDRVRRRYLYGNDRISMTTDAGTSYYHHDRIGSVTALTSADGDPEWAYGYEPFGTVRSAAKLSDGAPENPMRFAGEYQDPTTGLYHLRARELDPAVGRFLQRDPLEGDIRDPFVSTYVYARNRPTALVDPMGLWSWWTEALASDLDDVSFALGMAGLFIGAVGLILSFFTLPILGAALALAGLFLGLVGVMVNLLQVVGACGDGFGLACQAALLGLVFGFLGLGAGIGGLLASAARLRWTSRAFDVAGLLYNGVGLATDRIVGRANK